MLHSGIVDENIQRADIGHHRLNCGQIGKVSAEMLGVKLLAKQRNFAFLTKAIEDDLCPFRAQCASNSKANSRC